VLKCRKSKRNFFLCQENKLHPLGCRSCFATSDFPEHPKNKGLYKPHTLVWGALCFFDIKEGLSIRFSRKKTFVPNLEVKFPKRDIDKETFQDFIKVVLVEGQLKISSLERQIAFKKYYLKSEKDKEDALHIEELFKDSLDYEKINKLKELIKNIKD